MRLTSSAPTSRRNPLLRQAALTGSSALQHPTVGVRERLLTGQIVILLYPLPIVIQLRLKMLLLRARLALNTLLKIVLRCICWVCI